MKKSRYSESQIISILNESSVWSSMILMQMADSASPLRLYYGLPAESSLFAQESPMTCHQDMSFIELVRPKAHQPTRESCSP